MCTSIALKTKDFYFGRNLDLEYEFGERVVVTPRRYPIAFRLAGDWERHYAMIGMATVADGYPLYADAANEKGLCVAGLNFPGNAWYPKEAEPGKTNVSPFELPLWLLCQCQNVSEARALLEKTQLIGIDFNERMRLSPLHWHIADREASVVLECTREGMKIWENPVGVLTNNPPFDFHMTNLRQYMSLTPNDPKNQFSSLISLAPFGRGFGGIGLPGDYSPASRFIKAAFLKLNSACGEDEQSSVAQFFHLLDAVAMPRGAVMADGLYDVTTYSCCVNADKGIYYYKTYEGVQLTAVDMRRENLEECAVKEYPLERTQRISWAN